MTDSGFTLFDVVSDYHGPPLKMVLAGAGVYAMRLLEVPGASRVVDSIVVPYSDEFKLSFLRRNHPEFLIDPDELAKVPSVSQQMCQWLHEANCADLRGCVPLTVTAAVTTSRQRAGDNAAFIAVGPPNAYDIWHMSMHKLDDVDFEDLNKVETRRFIQDRMVGEIALSLVTEIPSFLLQEMEDSGYLKKI